MMTLDPNDQFFQDDDDSHERDQDQKNTKDTQLYKDTMILLKRKMCPAQNFLQQLSDKVKEYNDLNHELRESKLDKEKLFNKYNSISEKIARLELSNREYQKSQNHYKNTIDKQKLELEEKKKHIEQLEFKLKEMEVDSFHLKDEIKKLQQENKISKSIAKKITKSQASQTNCSQRQEASVNTDFKMSFTKKSQLKDKSIMTDESDSIAKEPFSIYCSKCENQVKPPPVGQILKIMSFHPPVLSDQISPPCSPRSIPYSSKQSESVASNTLEQCLHENVDSNIFDEQIILSTKKTNEESDKPSFMLIDKLTRKINVLEKLMKKNKKKQKRDSCCYQNCCSSKNIKFVVQLPNEEKYFNYIKRGRHKQTFLKRLNRKKLEIKNKKSLTAKEWHVENNKEMQDIKLSLERNKHQSKDKDKDPTRISLTDLFESPEIYISNSKLNNKINARSSDSDISSMSPILQSSQLESLSLAETTNTRVIENLTNEPLVFDDENRNQYNVLSSVGSPLILPNHENSVEKELQKMNCDSEQECKTTFNESDLSLDVLKEKNSNKTNCYNNQDCNDSVFITTECSKNKIIDIQNEDATSKNIEEKETNKQTTGRKIYSESENQKTCHESNKSLIMREINNTSENECSLTSKIINTSSVDAFSDMTNHKKEEIVVNDKEGYTNDFQEVHSVKKPDIFGKASKKIEVHSLPKRHRSISKNTFRKQINLENNFCESTDETDLSSDNSSDSKDFVAPRTKHGKSKNIFLSDESSEEETEDLHKNKHRKILLATRSKLISKIRNLKRTSKNPIILNTQTKETLQSQHLNASLKNSSKNISNESTILSSPINITSYIPTKRQRVAHTPRVCSEIKEIMSTKLLSQIPKTINENKKTRLNENTSSNSKIRKVKFTGSLTNTTKKLKLMKNDESKHNKEPLVISNEIKHESILTAVRPVETVVNNYDQHEIKNQVSIKKNNEDENNLKEKLEKKALDDNSNLNPSVLESIVDETESTENNLIIDVSTNSAKDENKNNVTTLDDSNEDVTIFNINREKIPTRKLRSRNVVIEKPTRRTSRRLQGNSLPNMKTDVGKDCLSNNLPVPVDLKKTQNTKKSKATKLSFMTKVDSSNSSISDSVILPHLNNFLCQINREIKPENFGYLKKYEKCIQENLSILVGTEPLTPNVLSQVSENLLTITKLEVVALVLVEYAASECLHDVVLVNMYTPPAPLMTKFEQKLVTLIMSIQEKQPEFINAVEKGLQYKLFRLGKTQEVQIVERLFRILVVLNKIKKDREKVRMFCCDALYCFNTRAMNIIFVALTCWPEIFPKHDSNNDILVKTIVHIIMSVNVNRPFSKLMPLKKLLTTYYGYPDSGFRVETFKQELLEKLQENVPGINTAILLLCKSKGAEWTLENVIKGGLKQMIVGQIHPSIYDALTLLGNLLRPFSSEDLKSSIEEITDQLCDVLAGNTGSHDLEEGIVSCLLSIGGKFIFKREKIALYVFKWHSNQDLRPTTKEKLNSFFKTHSPGWWRKFIRQHFPATK